MDSSTPEWMRLLLDTPLPPETTWRQASQDSNQESFADIPDVADCVLPSQITALASEAFVGGNGSLSTAGPTHDLLLGDSMDKSQEGVGQCGTKLPRWESSECSSGLPLSASAGVPEADQSQDYSRSKADFENVLSQLADCDKSCTLRESSSKEACGIERQSSSGTFSIQVASATKSNEDEELQNFVSACFFSGLQAVNLPSILSINSDTSSQEASPQPSFSRKRHCQRSQTSASSDVSCPSPAIAPPDSRLTLGRPPSCADVSPSEKALPLTSPQRRSLPAGRLEAALQRAVSRATTRRSSRTIFMDTALPSSPTLDLRGMNLDMHSNLMPKRAAADASAALPWARSGLESRSSEKEDDLFAKFQGHPNWNNVDLGWKAEEESMIREDEDGGGEGMEGFLMECGVGKRKRIMRERQRRSNIRQQVKRLRALLPAGNGRSIPQDTASIIAAAADYIKDLEGL